MQLNRYKDISDHWLEYKEALRNYILKIVKEPDAANSLSHEVLMKVYTSCCSGKDIRNLRSWLFQIAYNTCMDHFKKTNKTIELKGDFKSPENDLTYKEAGEFVEPLIALLPEKYAKPLALSDLQGLKQQEVADLLGLGLSATKTRIQRGRQMLKEQIMECVHVETDSNGNLTAFNIKASCNALRQHQKNCN